MTLTDEHIINLYAFTREHYVEYYDLQSELVDHMANDIEAIMDEIPQLTFDESRDKAFKKFGVFGFMEVVEQRQKAMNKIYMKLLWNYAEDWFRLPQIILTTAIFVGLYALFSTEISDFMFIACYSILCFWLVFKAIKFKQKIKQQRKAKEKIWLLEDLILQNAALGSLLFAPNILNVVYNFDGLEGHKSLLFAALFTITIIYTYISTIILPKNANFHLEETYPEYNM